MLELDGIHVAYGRVKALFGVSLTARRGQVLCVLGRNGAGKSTVMKAIMGLLPLSEGRITLGGQDIGGLPAHRRARARIGYVPQGRRLFPELTVAENVEMGLLAGAAGAATRERVLDLFPRLRERLSQRAATLSGGEQQMLATARALATEPEVLLLDEPTEGLQPSMIDLIRDVTLRMKDQGLAVILVEQRMDAILAMADQAVFLENGRSVAAMTGADLRADPARLQARLGI